MYRGLDSRTLLLVQKIKNGFLTDRATIETESSDTDIYGGSTHTWQLVATNIPCRLITQGNRSSAAGELGSQEGLVETYRIALQLGKVTLAVNQRITIGADIYHIVDILSNRTDQDEVQVTAKKDVR